MAASRALRIKKKVSINRSATQKDRVAFALAPMANLDFPLGLMHVFGLQEETWRDPEQTQTEHETPNREASAWPSCSQVPKQRLLLLL